MFQFSTLFGNKSNLLIDDVDTEAPALDTGSTMFYRDDSGEWQTVEIVDCEPRGWGWCNIKWSTLGGKHTKSVPIITLHDLDTYLDQDTEYSAYELAAHEADLMED